MKKLLLGLSLALWVSGALAQDVPNHAIPIGRGPGVIGWGTLTLSTGQLILGVSAADPIAGSLSGNTTKVATVVGTLTNGHCVSIDSAGNLIDAGGACTVGGGGGTVNAGTAGQLAFYASSTNAVSGETSLTAAQVGTNLLTNAMFAQVPALTFKCNATNSTANPTDCSYPLLNVKDFGAVGDGAHDDTTNIQNAINALPVSGGVVLLPVGNYKITASLVVGNGTSAVSSTRQGVILRGLGMPVRSSLTGFAATGGPLLTWAGATNSQMLVIKGPLVGWGVENLVFECGSTTGLTALSIISGQHGDSKNLVFNKCQTSINSATVEIPVGMNNSDSFHNNYTNTLINLPDLTGTNGFVLTGSGSATPTSDTDFNTVTNLTCLATSVSQVEACIYLQVADGNWLYGIHVTGGFPNLRAVSFDYSVNNAFPAGNKFFGLDPGGANKVTVNGAPCGASSCGDNELYGVSTANGGNLQTLAGVTYVFPGVTCAAGLPTAAFATFDGIVIHC